MFERDKPVRAMWPDTPVAAALRRAMLPRVDQGQSKVGFLAGVVDVTNRLWRERTERDPQLQQFAAPPEEIYGQIKRQVLSILGLDTIRRSRGPLDRRWAEQFGPLTPLTITELVERIVDGYFRHGSIAPETAAGLVDEVCSPIERRSAAVDFDIDAYVFDIPDDWDGNLDELKPESALTRDAAAWTWADERSGAVVHFDGKSELVVSGYATERAMAQWIDEIREIVCLGTSLLDAASFEEDPEEFGPEDSVITSAVWNSRASSVLTWRVPAVSEAVESVGGTDGIED